MKDKNLSLYAHNVKIITDDGIVTLKGPVRSTAEEKTILAKAEQVVGHNKIFNQLKITP